MTYDTGLQPPRPLLIAGRLRAASELALRRILRAKERRQALVVVDYQGYLAETMAKRLAGNVHKDPMLWCDVANRRKPIRLFQFMRSPAMRSALHGFLAKCVALRDESVTAPTLDVAVDIAVQHCDQGSIGLSAIARMLKRPELTHASKRNPATATELIRLHDVIEWALRFPTVWSLSEGNNVVDLGEAIRRGGTTWLEMHAAHLEPLEHRIAGWMLDAMILDALTTAAISRHTTPAAQDKLIPMVLYGFPGDDPAPMRESTLLAKQIGLFLLSEERSLPASAQPWIERHADCWITGPVGDLNRATKSDWFDQSERTRLKALEPGQVWVRAGSDRRAVTTLVRAPEANESLTMAMRALAMKSLRLSPVRQFSSAHAQLAPAAAAPESRLYDKLCLKETLYAGWYRVRTHNRHSHGFDRVTIEQFGSRVDQELSRLAEELIGQRYRCRPLRTTYIPKDDGDRRTLHIASVRDRVVQAACLQLLEPLFEPRFSVASFAYRPGRSAHQAVALARASIATGNNWAVTADIRKCFDSIDHDILLRLVGDVVCDADLIQLLRHWLTADVIDFMDVTPSELGVPQGAAISPLLANIYLDPMDKEFERAGLRFARYADDYLVLCASEAEAQSGLRLMAEFLQGSLRMALKPAKTNYCSVAEGVRFLGFSIGHDGVRIQSDKLTRIARTVGECARKFTDPVQPVPDRWNAFTRLNAMVRGIRNYFSIDDAPGLVEQFAQLDNAVEAAAGPHIGVDPSFGPPWLARERFKKSAEIDVERVESAAVGSVSGYPAVGPATLGSVPALELDGESSPRKAAPNPTQSGAVGRNGVTEEAPLDPDYMVIKGRLHVMRSGCYATISGSELVIRRRKAEVSRTPIAELSMVYLEGKGIAVSADLAMTLCEQDIPVVFAPLVGLPAAITQALHSNRSHVRQQQVMRRNDADIMHAGLAMLAAKVANQASVLKYFARYRKKTGDGEAYGQITRAADEVREIGRMLESIDPASATARSTWMGHEGRAAAKYWTALALLVPSALGFPGRHTRHATDPVNSAINYVYGMLYGEVWRSVTAMGLDPYFGIVHGTERDQGSLVFDLIEEYRAPFGDRVVLSLLGRGFEIAMDTEGRLKLACRRKLISAFHKSWNRTVRWRGNDRTPASILDSQVSSVKNTYLGKDEYTAFRFRW